MVVVHVYVLFFCKPVAVCVCVSVECVSRASSCEILYCPCEVKCVSEYGVWSAENISRYTHIDYIIVHLCVCAFTARYIGDVILCKLQYTRVPHAYDGF